MLTLAMAVFMLLPTKVYAQSDNFFRGGNDAGYRSGDDPDALNLNVENQSFQTPLGGGLLIMMAAGIAYIALKRKQKMRRFCVLFICVVLVLGLSQCKKNAVDTIVTASSYEKVKIVLNTNDNSKLDVNTTTGKVTFEKDDIIYVVSDGVYVGTLTHNGSNFSGTISGPTEGLPLYFYFFGNQQPSTLTENTTTTCTFDIIDQTDALKMPVVSFGHSNEDYYSSETSYSATLNNKCALVKLDVTNGTGANTYIMGMNNMVTVNFENSDSNPFTFNKMGTGAINIGSRTGEVWVIMLPNISEVEDKAYSSEWSKNGDISVPSIEANKCYASGIEVNININNNGELPGEFSGDGSIFHFSMGNLKATTNDSWATWTFSFMEHQYDRVETGDVTTDYNGLASVSLFGWGTSGANMRNTETNYYYKPFNTNNSNGNYYGPDNSTGNLTGRNINADWGHYNTITNGGGAGIWRTPTSADWNKIITNRASSQISYCKANVNGVNCLLLLPDGWIATNSTYTLNSTNTTGANYTTNVITLADWTKLEACGAVLLATTGFRSGTTVSYSTNTGIYWSSTSGISTEACSIIFQSGTLIVNSYRKRYSGCAVRLVR